MIKLRTKLKVFIILLASIFLIGWIDPASDKNEEGLQLYNEQVYDEAISKFTDAQLHVPASETLGFNIANTHYKEGKLPEAEKAYKEALNSKDVTLKAKANYNMGNTLFKQGKLNEALDFYKKSIELTENKTDNKDDEAKGIREDAKYNYEFVQKKMEEMKQEQQERQEQEEQEKQEKEEEDKQEEQEQGDQPPEDKDSEEKEQEKEQKQDQQQQEKDQEEQNKDKNNQDGQEQPPPEDDKADPQPQPQEKKEMTKEEAERILDALKQSEESAREMKEKEYETSQFGVERNW